VASFVAAGQAIMMTRTPQGAIAWSVSLVSFPFVADFEHSVLIDPAEFDKKPFWWRLGVRVSRLASPVL